MDTTREEQHRIAMERHRQRVDRERKDSKRLSPVCRGVLRKGSLHQSKGLGKGPAPNAPKQVEAHVQVVVGGKYGVNMTFGAQRNSMVMDVETLDGTDLDLPLSPTLRRISGLEGKNGSPALRRKSTFFEPKAADEEALCRSPTWRRKSTFVGKAVDFKAADEDSPPCSPLRRASAFIKQAPIESDEDTGPSRWDAACLEEGPADQTLPGRLSVGLEAVDERNLPRGALRREHTMPSQAAAPVHIECEA
jgi:hypothetical protein